MSAPWSAKGSKGSIVNADEFLILDSADATPATKNKRVAFSVVSANLAKLNATQTFTGINTFTENITTRLPNADTDPAHLRVQTFSNNALFSSHFIADRARGDSATPSAILDGDFIGGLEGSGHDGTSFSGGAFFNIQAAGGWTGSSQPTRAIFSTTPVSSTTPLDRLVIGPDGTVSFETNDVENMGTLNTNTIPAGTDTFAMLGGTQTFTGRKTFTGITEIDTDDFNFRDSTDTTKGLGFDLSGSSTGTGLELISSVTAIRFITFPDATTTLVGTDVTQTLTNKTLTLPTISSIDNGGTITIPSGVDTFAMLGAAQTFTGVNTFTAASNDFTNTVSVDKLEFDDADTSLSQLSALIFFDVAFGGGYVFRVDGTSEFTFGAGAISFNGNDLDGVGLLNSNIIPAGPADTLAMLELTQTLSNKTLDTPTIASFVNAGHDHEAAAGGGQLTATLALDATGTKDDTTFLRGDDTYAVSPGQTLFMTNYNTSTPITGDFLSVSGGGVNPSVALINRESVMSIGGTLKTLKVTVSASTATDIEFFLILNGSQTALKVDITDSTTGTFSSDATEIAITAEDMVAYQVVFTSGSLTIVGASILFEHAPA